jgi:CRISPR type III-A-associated RAMP protein Csm5
LLNNDNLYREFERELQKLLTKPLNQRELNKFAQQWEEKIFRAQGVRQSAITDIFKTLHISDSPLTDPAEVLSLKNLRLVGGSPRAIWSECLKPTTKWNFDINIDQNQLEYLPRLFPDLEKKLKGLNQLEQFIEIVDSFYRELIDFELETLDRLDPQYNKWAGELKNVYQKLKQFKQPLLRLGKHTGRYTHSILLVLRKKNKDLFEDVLKEFTSKTRWITKENMPLGWAFLITTKG